MCELTGFTSVTSLLHVLQHRNSSRTVETGLNSSFCYRMKTRDLRLLCLAVFQAFSASRCPQRP
jgi:hypothetical protein